MENVLSNVTNDDIFQFVEPISLKLLETEVQQIRKYSSK